MVNVDKNLAEPQPVIGAEYTVAPGAGTLQSTSSFIGVTNGNFETHTGDRFAGWDVQDAVGSRTFADTNIFHSGSCSLRIDPGPLTNSYSCQAAPAGNGAIFACRATDYGGWTLTDPATLTVRLPSPARFTSYTRAADGTLRLRFTGSVEAAYALEVSTNLVNWFRVAQGITVLENAFDFEDPATATNSVRFYKSVGP